MSATGTTSGLGRNPSFSWRSLALFVAVVAVIPFAAARLIGGPNQLGVAIFFAVVGLLGWLIYIGTGARPVPKDMIVIRKGPGDQIDVFTKGSYPFLPLTHSIAAVLPKYPLRFEFDVDEIDTQTANLGRISKIVVRLDCSLSLDLQGIEKFYKNAMSRTDRIKELEESKKLQRTDPTLWKEFIGEVVHELVDDALREVVWRWKVYLDEVKAEALIRAIEIDKILDYAVKKDDGSWNLDGDPYSLSRNRRLLADKAKAAVKTKLDAGEWALTIDPLVLESIKIDDKIIERATSDRKRERERAVHEAAKQADAIRETGNAEAEVRAKSLAGILDVLINQHDIPYDDPLIADLIRAALYKDGEITWKRVLEKGADGDGTAKTA